MHVVVVASGELPGNGVEAARRLCETADVVIAADGGLRHCSALDVRADHLVGDLDSASPDHVAEARSNGITVHAYPTDKDATDLELAMELARELAAARITVVAPFGGRLDHELATIALLASTRWQPVDVSAFDGRRSLWVVHHSLRLRAEIGETASLVPINGDARGVNTTGLQWPLSDATLAFGTTRGVSNVAIANEQNISVTSGVLLVVTDSLEAG